MIENLRLLDCEQKEKLKRKLSVLCDNSKWNTVGRTDLITNLSSKRLTNTEQAALSLGLKFDTGTDKKSYVEHVSRNYKWNDKDVEKGLTHGILAFCKALSNSKPRVIPKSDNSKEG